MKKYVAPELNKILFDVADIITLSVATDTSDSIKSAEEEDWNDFNFDGNGYTWFGIRIE